MVPPVRVIAGVARGIRLTGVPAGTRPLSDRAREGVFSHLGDAVIDARCLDLFAGTGAVGIEALSRGAGSSVFVDQSAAAIRTIRDNLSKTGLAGRARVVRSAVERYVRRGGEAFHLAFLDPPYALGAAALRRILREVVERVEPGGTFVLTRPARDDRDVIPVNWGVAKLLAYGDTRVLVCREGL